MKKMFYLLFVVFLFGCCQLRYLGKFPIPDDLRSVLKDGESLFDKDSMTNKIDTFVINVSDYYRTVDESGDYESINISYNRKNKKKALSTFQSQAYMYIMLYGYDFEYATFAIKHPIVNNVVISGVNYPEIYCSKESYLPDSVPNKVYYTPQQGILRYDYHDGRHFERISK
jgi:hypothetical protein